MDRLLQVWTLLSLALVLLVLAGLRRAHIRVEYSVAWLGAALLLLLMSRSPLALHSLSQIMGITYTPLALVMLVLCIFIVVFYRFSIRISDLKDVNIALAQRLAILEFRLQQLHETRQDQRKTSGAS